MGVLPFPVPPVVKDLYNFIRPQPRFEMLPPFPLEQRGEMGPPPPLVGPPVSKANPPANPGKADATPAPSVMESLGKWIPSLQTVQNTMSMPNGLSDLTNWDKMNLPINFALHGGVVPAIEKGIVPAAARAMPGISKAIGGGGGLISGLYSPIGLLANVGMELGDIGFSPGGFRRAFTPEGIHDFKRDTDMDQNWLGYPGAALHGWSNPIRGAQAFANDTIYDPRRGGWFPSVQDLAYLSGLRGEPSMPKQ